MKHTTSVLAAFAAAIVLAACQDSPITPVPDPDRGQASANVHTGWIFGPGEEPVEVRYEIIDGMSILEGDIDLGPAGSVPRTRDALLGRGEGPSYGVVIDGSTKRWGGGVVPYVISSSFTSTQRQTILDAMSHVASSTAGTKFVARTTQSAYVSFVLHSSTCSSAVGRTGSNQAINLTSGCAGSMGTVAHEVLHALGMWHEQSRCDRDTRVTIHLENVVSGKEHNFDKKCTGSTDLLTYSEGSIMHYSRYAFSKNGLPTISSNVGLNHLITGQTSGLVQSDRSTINSIYKPYAPTGFTGTYPSGVPTLAWNAYSAAVEYRVFFTTFAEEDDYERGYSSSTYTDFVGTTTSTTIQDLQRSYTGNDYCQIYSGTYGSAWETYTYEVQAKLPDGIWSHLTSVPAYVATC